MKELGTENASDVSPTELTGFTKSSAFFSGMLSQAREKTKMRLSSEPDACSSEALHRMVYRAKRAREDYGFCTFVVERGHCKNLAKHLERILLY